MPATMWKARELERLTAAKLAEAGIVPLLRPRDPDTQAEIDVYALSFASDSVTKALIECKTAPPSNKEIQAINGLLSGYGGDEAVLVTTQMPHGDQVKLAKKIGVTLLCTHAKSNLHTACILGKDVDFARSLGRLGQTVMATYRCFAGLERKARECAKEGKPEAYRVVQSYSSIVNSILTEDPIERARDLYDLHFESPRLAEDCALAEGLDDDPREAVKEAYAHGKGTYTQSALMVHTLNKWFTIAAVAERACKPTKGSKGHELWETVAIPPRVDGIRRWLAEQRFKEFVAPLMFYLVFAFGGFWPTAVESDVFDQFHRLTGAPRSSIESIIGMINEIFRTQGTDAIKEVDYPWYPWKNLILCPYPLKGVGCRFMISLNIPVRKSLGQRWERSLGKVEEECEEYERAH